MKGIGVVIHPWREPSLMVRGTQVQIRQHQLQICNTLLPIRPKQPCACRSKHSTSPFAPGVTIPQRHFKCSSAFANCRKRRVATSPAQHAHLPHHQCYRNSTDLFYLWVVVFLPQPFAQYGRGCNLHNLQILHTFFPNNCSFVKNCPPDWTAGSSQKPRTPCNHNT